MKVIDGIKVHLNAKDIRGKIFGRLTVVSLAYNRNSTLYWLCRCQCGRTAVIPSSNLGNGHTQSCGCLCAEKSAQRAKRKKTINGHAVGYRTEDLTGRIFGRLCVESCEGKRGSCILWKCKCECGTGSLVSTSQLTRTSHPVRSCGCLRENAWKAATKHGMSNAPEYDVWVAMKDRCYNRANPGYANYGGRGIRVCNRWRHSFETFIADMGHRPNGRLSIERIDNNGMYEPSNCKWATAREQACNKRKTIYVLLLGMRIPLSEVARTYGVSYGLLYARIRHGWTLTRALSEPRHTKSAKEV